MKALEINRQIETTKTAPPEYSIEAIIAGLAFTICFNYFKNYPQAGRCKNCRKKVDFYGNYKEGKENETLNVIEFIKIEEVQFNYKGYTADNIESAHPFVKELFSKIIIALKKSVQVKKLYVMIVPLMNFRILYCGM